MKLSLKILTPLHIGCGDVHSGLNYIIYNGNIYFFDYNSISKHISSYETKFVKWIEKNSTRLERLQQQKKKTRDKREIEKRIERLKQEFTLEGFFKQRGLSIESLCKDAIYHMPHNNENLGSYPEINAFIKQMNKVYIPGTEVKGAIRTALAYYILRENNSLYTWLKNMLHEFGKQFSSEITKVANSRNPDKKLKKKLNYEMSKIDERLSNKIFYSKPKDAKFDVFKFLTISDSELKDPFEVLRVGYVFPINIKRSFSVYHEYIVPETTFKLFNFTILNGFVLNEAFSKMNFNKLHSQMINLDFIKKTCYEFANDLIEEEIDFFTNIYKDNDIVSMLNQLLKINTPENPLIRIGKDQGYLSITTSLVVKKKDPEVYENILIHATKNKSYIGKDLLPKSRKMIYLDGRKYLSGWCQLVFEG